MALKLKIEENYLKKFNYWISNNMLNECDEVKPIVNWLSEKLQYPVAGGAE